ncbi:hypothetical protein DFP72DRAFT_963469, partial [Ephemerocybe angulata]
MVSEISTCPHIQAELAENFGEAIFPRYKQVLTWNVHRAQAVRAPKRRRIAAPVCGVCELALSRPFACLHCDKAFCWENGHAKSHLRHAKHMFCADVKSGRVYCSLCDDFIYDPRMEDVYTRTIVSAEEKETRFQESGKLREAFRPWTPSEKDQSALDASISIPCQSRRGLVNLGQTCFLNAVLQCLIHNPLLRNYFLGDKHNWRNCKVEQCTCCEMDKLFSEIYSTSTSSNSNSLTSSFDPNTGPSDAAPFGPTSFLYTLWKVASSELSSGYAQQDAHEFFICTLNQIHTTCRGSTNVSCNCIIHNTFAGQLQSDVKCERCGNTTSTIDPMLDISLELKGRQGQAEASGENTLQACLRRFTQPERLNPKEYSCSKCSKGSPEATKRLSIRKLPSVLSFQFKRFEHKTNFTNGDRSTSRKIDTPVRFPSTINMAPYTTMVMRDMEKENASNNNGSGSSVPFTHQGPESLYDYDLFAVINHTGALDNGHYTAFALSPATNEWYRFDDDKVSHASAKACLEESAGAYMCFYVKRRVEYKAYQVPSYVLVRETEALRERER